MKLLVVIVNFRVAHLVIDCLHSVAREIGNVPTTRVAVCENGTGDNSAERIQQAIDDNGWRSWCTLKALNVNLGFTGGNNAVIRPALQSSDPPQYVLLLNPDTVVRPQAFKALIDFMDHNPKVGIAGSGMENPDGSPQCSAFRFQSALSEFESRIKLGLISRLLTRWVVAPPVDDRFYKTDWVSGASMIIRRQVFEDIGLLDEGYFTYFDDIDFCFNARKKGWPTWYAPTSRVIHLAGQSTGITNAAKPLPSYMFDARRRYFLKNHGPLYAAVTDICMIAGQLLWQLRVFFTRKNNTAPPHLLRDSLRHSVFWRGFKLEDVAPTLKSQPPHSESRKH